MELGFLYLKRKGINMKKFIIKVFEDGSIETRNKGKHFGSKNNKGYLVFTRNNKTYLVHREVAKRFIPNPNGFNEVDHIDGNKTNNHYTNLRWCTRNQNMKWASEKGVMKHNNYSKGENHSSNFKKKDILDIRKRVANGERQDHIALEYNVSKTCIHRIIHRKTWSHI